MAQLIRTDGRVAVVETVHPKDGHKFTLQEYYKLINCEWIDMLTVYPNGRHQELIVDDNGRQKGLPVNKMASQIAGFVVVGDVLLCDIENMGEDNERCY